MRDISWKRNRVGDRAIDDKKLVIGGACEVSDIVELSWSIEPVVGMMLLMDKSGILWINNSLGGAWRNCWVHDFVYV